MSALLEAIKNGDLLSISALANQSNINQTTQYHPEQTPLLAAIMNNQVQAAKLLIDLGANTNLDRYYVFRTPLEYACQHNNLDMVKLLLDNGANIALTQHDSNPASYAVKNNNYPLIDLLLSHGIDLNAGFNQPIVTAAQENNLTAVKYLLELGANINADFDNNIFASSAIVEAANHGHQEMVQFLLDNGANADTFTYCQESDRSKLSSAYNSSAIFNALENGHIEIAQLLMNAGAGIQEGITPLHVAVLNGDIHEIESLLASGMDADVLNAIGQSPLHYALYANNIAALDLLKQYGADISLEIQSTYYDLYPMEMAIYANAKEACVWLVNNGIDINQTYEFGETALHIAASEGKMDYVSLFLDLGANIDVKDEDGNSIIASGIYSDDPQMIALLIENGAQLNVQNNHGQTELFKAANNLRHNENDNAVLKYLLEHGSDPSIKDISGYTALDYFKFLNKNTGHLVANYNDICEILGKYQSPSSDKANLHITDVLDHHVDILGEQLPASSPSSAPTQEHVSLYTQLYNWVFGEQQTTPLTVE